MSEGLPLICWAKPAQGMPITRPVTRQACANFMASHSCWMVDGLSWSSDFAAAQPVLGTRDHARFGRLRKAWSLLDGHREPDRSPGRGMRPVAAAAEQRTAEQQYGEQGTDEVDRSASLREEHGLSAIVVTVHTTKIAFDAAKSHSTSSSRYSGGLSRGSSPPRRHRRPNSSPRQTSLP